LTKFDKIGRILLVGPPLLAGLILGANQTRAGAYMPWLLSISYWVTISLLTWWCLAIGTMVARWLLRPWSTPEWVNWIIGAVAGSLAARPMIYSVAELMLPLMEAPALRKMRPVTVTLDFLLYYLTNWSVVIIMWLLACWVAAKWRDKSRQNLPAIGPQGADRDERLNVDPWETDPFLTRIPPAIGRDILALHAEDHYVRVYTAAGDVLLLAAMAEAIKIIERSGCSGYRVHRSWWIAQGSVIGSTDRGRQTVVTLANKIEIPVSQTYREVVRRSGLLTAP
jgi:LytTr DNA-binding domain